jgi:AcrR family transcriptional regulator
MGNEGIKEKIISESIELFMSYGLRSVTMDDIAKHLGISKKTIYQHFKDKEEIIFLATAMHFEKEHKSMKEIASGTENAVEELYNITICLREKTKKTNSSVLFDLKKYYKRAWDNYQKYKHDSIFNSVLNNLKRGIVEGLFRSDVNPEILAYLRIAQIELTFNKEYFPEEKFTLNEIHEQVFEHYTHGILSEKGLKLLETYKQKAI